MRYHKECGTNANCEPGKLFIYTITGYYGFFCLFMLGVALQQRHIMHYCGFLKGIFMKSLFYVFLASLAFANITWWENLVVGGIFGACCFLSWFQYCGKKNPEEEDATAK